MILMVVFIVVEEQVFGSWEDGRYYAAWINGVRQS